MLARHRAMRLMVVFITVVFSVPYLVVENNFASRVLTSEFLRIIRI